jgi:cytoskeletal protein RodZ
MAGGAAMAALPLNTETQDAFAELLSSLEPNVQPMVPSVWPLAIGYWLLISIVIAAILVGIFWWIRTKPWRVFKTELKRIKQLTDAQEQLVSAHLSLRWLVKEHQLAPTGLSPREFESFIAARNGNKTPAWLNKHYQPETQASVDWVELQRIAKRLIQEART